MTTNRRRGLLAVSLSILLTACATTGAPGGTTGGDDKPLPWCPPGPSMPWDPPCKPRPPEPCPFGQPHPTDPSCMPFPPQPPIPIPDHPPRK